MWPLQRSMLTFSTQTDAAYVAEKRAEASHQPSAPRSLGLAGSIRCSLIYGLRA